MPIDDRSFHRKMRFSAIEDWALRGAARSRKKFPVEMQFEQRLGRIDGALFRPLRLPYSDDFEYNREVSYILDALDVLPGRVDIAFDSAWKALESRSKALFPNMNQAAWIEALCCRNDLDFEAIDPLLCGAPMQSCEFLFGRAVRDYQIATSGSDGGVRHQPNRRFKYLKDSSVKDLIGALVRQYPNPDLEASRKGAALLRRVMRGESLTIDGRVFCLDRQARTLLLLAGIIYTARNDRYHGDSFSPFVSSAAKLSTYTHPHYMFVCTYSLWCLSYSSLNQGVGIEIDANLISRNIEENLTAARALFGSHWN